MYRKAVFALRSRLQIHVDGIVLALVSIAWSRIRVIVV